MIAEAVPARVSGRSTRPTEPDDQAVTSTTPEPCYQVNVWDRYNWDVNQNKGVEIYGQRIGDSNQANLHQAGLAKEFDMRGNSSVKHMDLTHAVGNPPAPDEPGWRNSRADPGRESAGR